MAIEPAGHYGRQAIQLILRDLVSGEEALAVDVDPVSRLRAESQLKGVKLRAFLRTVHVTLQLANLVAYRTLWSVHGRGRHARRVEAVAPEEVGSPGHDDGHAYQVPGRGWLAAPLCEVAAIGA